MKKSIKFIVDQLERNNYVYIRNDETIPACRLFARFTRDYKGKINVTSGNGFIKNIISLDPSYRIERIGDYVFKLKIRIK